MSSIVTLVSLTICSVSFLIFLVALFLYISPNYNYNQDGTVIKDDIYNSSQKAKNIFYIFVLITIVSFLIFKFYE